MRYWIDTEFIEDGRTIDLLSIGIVAADGRELYQENSEADLTRADPWVRANVFTSMTFASKDTAHPELIAARVRAFCDPAEFGPPEFWGYYADYDWVVLCQLFGRMVDLPKGWPMFCCDFKQEISRPGCRFELQKLPEAEAHNALADARWLRREHIRFAAEQPLRFR